MKKIWIIARKDIGEALRSRSTYAFILVMLIVTLNLINSYDHTVKTLTTPQAIGDFSRTFLNSLSYTLPLMYSIFVCSIFATYSVVVDKAKRNIESLMATPVSVNQLWMGKSLAVMMPSFLVGLSVSILAYLLMSFAFVMPHTHEFIFPAAVAIVSALIIIPALVFSIVAIVINIQLIIANPKIANLVFTFMFILVLLGVTAFGGLGVSLNYLPLVYLGIIAVCALVAFVMSRTLTKEKVLLSSKM